MLQDSQPIAEKLPFWRRLRWNLVVIFFVLALLPVTAVTFLTVTDARQQRIAQVTEQLKSIAELKRGQINSWLNAGDATLRMFLSETARKERFKTFALDSQNQGDEPSAAYSAEQDAINLVLRDAVKEQDFFQEIFVYSPTGLIVAGSDAIQIDKIVDRQPYFETSLTQDYIHPPHYSVDTNELTIVITHRLFDENGQVAGVVAGRLNMETLSSVMTERTGMENGETYLVSSESHYLITRSRYEDDGWTLAKRYKSDGITRALGEAGPGAERDGSGVYNSYRGVTVIGVYRWLPELQAAMLAEVGRADALASADRTRNLSIGLAAVIALVAIGAGLWFSTRISEPIVELTRIATQVASGDLEQRAPATQRDEIGLLGRAFNSMAEQLQYFIGSLEQRISERTRNLQTASEVSRATTSVLDPDELLSEVVNLVRERFGLYYVGLFLLDPKKRYAVLRAGTGRAGREMLAQGHKLEVSGSSMIGRCIARDEASVALHVGAEAVRRYANPYLPDTRSEIAMPMRSRGQVVGAMTVQSDKEAAFDETDIAVMQTMADQVGVALDNARLFSETQAALEEAAATHRRYLRRAWSEYTKIRPVSGYQQAEGDLTPLGQQMLSPVQQELTQSAPGGKGDDDAGVRTLVEPIVLRGQPIGALGFAPKADARPWSDDDFALVQTVASQLAQAIENLRLSQETERRAAREQLIGRVTGRMRESLDLDTVLRITTQEMRESLGLHSVMIQLEIGDESQDDEDVRAGA